MSNKPLPHSREFLEKLTRLRKFSGSGQVALHKPVMLLYALSEFEHRKAKTIHYRAAENVVSPILARFGQTGTRARVADPFARLESDGFWKLRTTHREEIFDKSGNARPGQLNKFDVEAGFDEDVLDLLRADATLVAEAVKIIADVHIPSTIRSEVLEMVGWEARP